jgi:hypothetical protein
MHGVLQDLSMMVIYGDAVVGDEMLIFSCESLSAQRRSRYLMESLSPRHT